MTELFILFFPAIVLGLAAGIIPGPIISAGSFSILQSSQKGFQQACIYCLYSFITEVLLGTFLFYLGSAVITEYSMYLHIIGGSILLYFGYKALKGVKNFHLIGEKEKFFSRKDIVLMVISNAELILFHLLVLFPFMVAADEKIFFGGTSFLLIFIVAVHATMITLFYGISLLKKKFETLSIFKAFPYIIVSSFFLFGIGMIISGMQKFF